MLRSSGWPIRQSLTPKVITWPVCRRWYAKFRNDPNFPEELYHPSFTIGFRVQTSPEDTINVVRQKYAPPGTLVTCWDRIRAFPPFPIDHQDFCEHVLAKAAEQQSTFSVEIGRPFFSRAKELDIPALIGFRLAPSPILQRLHESLSAEFGHIQEKMLRGRTHHDPSKVPFLAKGRQSTGRKYYPSVRICRVLGSRLISRFNEIKEQHPDGAGKVKVIGLVLGRDARKEHYQSPDAGDVPYTFFPFRDFGKEDCGNSGASLVDWNPVDLK
jgi:hypothetical protein